MEDQADRIACLPTVSFLDLLDHSARRVAKDSRIVGVARLARELAKQLVAVTPEDGRDADVAMPLSRARLRKLSRPHSYHQLISNG